MVRDIIVDLETPLTAVRFNGPGGESRASDDIVLVSLVSCPVDNMLVGIQPDCRPHLVPALLPPTDVPDRWPVVI